jgi:RNA polymerase sigma factor (sigma-70 family)
MADVTGDSGRPMPPDLGRYRNMMRGWARRAGVAREDESDVVQEAMLKAVKYEARLSQLDEKQLPAWLKTTTRRKALDADRHRRRRKRGNGNVRSFEDMTRAAGGTAPVEPVADDTSPSKRAELGELRDRLLGQLPDDERDVLRLILSEKWPADKVAGHLGLTREQVGLKAGAGLIRMRQMLKRMTQVSDAERAQ